MKFLRNKKVLVLSPQSWGKMRISKHHYALKLAALGNEVCFVNPPLDRSHAADVKWEDGVQVLSYPRPFFYNLKFHWAALYKRLMSWYMRRVLRTIQFVPDVVLSFDLGGDYPLEAFPDCVKLFFPVDEPQSEIARNSGSSADLVFSVTHEILEQFEHLPAPKVFLNHGVADLFLHKIPSGFTKPDEAGQIRFGYAGNLLRPDIDRPMMQKIVCSNPDVQFEMWGAYANQTSNLGSGSMGDAEHSFIALLSDQENVVLHGPVSAQELVDGFARMNGFLICYNIEKDQSSGTNYHKILEYLATGKVIVSNSVTTYRDMPLFRMCNSRSSNDEMPLLFTDTVEHIDEWNSEERCRQRIEFAAAHTYSKQLEKIDDAVTRLPS